MTKRETNIYQRCGRPVYGRSYPEVRSPMERSGKNGNRLLFSQLLIAWAEDSRSRIKESSYQCYLTKLRVHILPYFKDLPYRELTSRQIMEFVSRKLAEGLSAKYVSDMVIIMKSCAKWAGSNFGLTDRIHSAVCPKVRREEPQLLSAGQRKVFAEQLISDHDTTSSGVLLAMFSGLRIGELCALQWQDIDLENAVLHIRSTLQRIKVSDLPNRTSVVITSPKTESSRRDIPLPAFMVNILENFRSSPTDYLLSGGPRPIEPRLMNYRFKKLLKRAGLPSVRFHALRHTFATLCLQQDFDIKTLSEILGHSGADVTLKTYVHSSLERKRQCMNRLSPELF